MAKIKDTTSLVSIIKQVEKDIAELKRQTTKDSATYGFVDVAQELGATFIAPLDSKYKASEVGSGGYSITAEGGVSAGEYVDGPTQFGLTGSTDFDGSDDRFSTNYGTRRNYMTNPRFGKSNELDPPDGWDEYAGTEQTTTHISGGAPFGNLTCLEVVISGSTGTNGLNLESGDEPAAVSGETWSAGMWVKATSTDVGIRIFGRNSGGGAEESCDITSHSGSGNWEWLTCTITLADPNTAKVDLVVASSNEDITWRVWGAILEKSSSVGAYFDGSGYIDEGSNSWISDAGGHVGWLGTAHDSASDKGVFANGTVRTFAGWLKRPISGSDYDMMFAGDGDLTFRTYFAETNDYVYLEAWGNGGATVSWTSAGIATTNWIHVTFIFDEPNNLAYLYLDGNLISSQTMADQYKAGSGNLKLGAVYGGAAYPLKGQMAGIAVFERGLSKTEISGLVANPPYILGDHRLDQHSAPINDVDMNSNKITSLSNGTASTDAVNKSQLDTKAGLADANTFSNSPQTISHAGGKDTLAITSSATDTGITIGTDTNLYRQSTGVLATDGAIKSIGATAASNAFYAEVTGDTLSRYNIDNDGKTEWGDGSSARDTNLYRSAANTLKTDDSLIVSGYVTANTLTAAATVSTPNSVITATATGTGRALKGDSTAGEGVQGGGVYGVVGYGSNSGGFFQGTGATNSTGAYVIGDGTSAGLDAQNPDTGPAIKINASHGSGSVLDGNNQGPITNTWVRTTQYSNTAASYTVTATNIGQTIYMNSSSAQTIYFPGELWATGDFINIVTWSQNQIVTIAAAGSPAPTSFQSNGGRWKMAGQYCAATVYCITGSVGGASYLMLVGDTKA